MFLGFNSKVGLVSSFFLSFFFLPCVSLAWPIRGSDWLAVITGTLLLFCTHAGWTERIMLMSCSRGTGQTCRMRPPPRSLSRPAYISGLRPVVCQAHRLTRAEPRAKTRQLSRAAHLLIQNTQTSAQRKLQVSFPHLRTARFLRSSCRVTASSASERFPDMFLLFSPQHHVHRHGHRLLLRHRQQL